MKFWYLLILVVVPPLPGQGPEHLGPVPTRDQFPINFGALTYVPAAPDVQPEGTFEVDLQCVEANTFEFSSIVQDSLQGNPPPNRLSITLPEAQQFAAKYPGAPLIFFFNVETTLTTLRIRSGLGAGREAWMQVSALGWSGGFEDGLIDWTHRALGFNQFGREHFEPDQVRVVVIQSGQVTEFSDHGAGPRVLDPVLGLTQNLLESDTLALAANLQVKPPLMRGLFDFRSGWDAGVQMTGRWTPSATVDAYFGFGGVRRRSGNLAFNQHGTRDQLGFHAMVEGCRQGSWRPFIQLIYLTGSTFATPGDQLDKPSLQHDLGIHWIASPNLRFTLRYFNNISNNNNTADMALAAGVSWRFHSASIPDPAP